MCVMCVCLYVCIYVCKCIYSLVIIQKKLLNVFYHQNAHAYVNAGFNWSLDPSTFAVQGSPSIVFGGLQAHAVSLTMCC